MAKWAKWLNIQHFEVHEIKSRGLRWENKVGWSDWVGGGWWVEAKTLGQVAGTRLPTSPPSVTPPSIQTTSSSTTLKLFQLFHIFLHLLLVPFHLLLNLNQPSFWMFSPPCLHPLTNNLVVLDEYKFFLIDIFKNNCNPYNGWHLI